MGSCSMGTKFQLCKRNAVLESAVLHNVCSEQYCVVPLMICQRAATASQQQNKEAQGNFQKYWVCLLP